MKKEQLLEKCKKCVYGHDNKLQQCMIERGLTGTECLIFMPKKKESDAVMKPKYDKTCDKIIDMIESYGISVILPALADLLIEVLDDRAAGYLKTRIKLRKDAEKELQV